MDTNGDFFANAYVARSEQDAEERASLLIADMAETMGIEDFDATRTWKIGAGSWWYRVRVQDDGNPFA